MRKMIIDEKGRKTKIKREKIFLQENPSLYSSDVDDKRRITYKVFNTERNMRIVKLWRGKGWSAEKIADKIGVSKQCIYGWVKKYPEFKKIWYECVGDIVYTAEKGMTDLIRPQERKIKETITYTDKDGHITGRRTRETVTTDPPDFKACKYMLENFSPNEYKDRQSVQLSGDISVTAIDIAGILAEARKKAKGEKDEK